MNDRACRESGHLMLITPERVFYAGLLGRPRERCPGAFHVYVSIEAGLWLTIGDGRESYGELAVVPPNVRHTIASDYRSAICVLIEPESVRAGAFEELAARLSGAEGQFFAQRIRAAYGELRQRQRSDDITSAEFDTMCFGEALPPRSLDPRVVRSIAQIGRFCGEPVTAAELRGGGRTVLVALPASVQAGDRNFVPRLPGLEARAAPAALRQPGPQSRASGAGYRLSRTRPISAIRSAGSTD